MHLYTVVVLVVEMLENITSFRTGHCSALYFSSEEAVQLLFVMKFVIIYSPLPPPPPPPPPHFLHCFFVWAIAKCHVCFSFYLCTKELVCLHGYTVGVFFCLTYFVLCVLEIHAGVSERCFHFALCLYVIQMENSMSLLFIGSGG